MMKALSLHQPWASLLVSGHKQMETRSWPIYYRGPLLIHAAKKWNIDLAEMTRHDPFRSALAAIGVVVPDVGWSKPPPALPLGAVVGRVLVTGGERTEYAHRLARNGGGLWLTDKERAFGDYSPGRFCITCRDFQRFTKPYPLRGRQGLFNVADEIMELIEQWVNQG